MAAGSFDYRDGIVINRDAKPGDIDAKMPHVDHGTGKVSPDRYYSHEIHNREWECMWTKVWTLAGLVCDVPNVGDFLKYDLGRESFVIVRTAAEKIQAFYNVCPHRGNQLVEADFGSVGDCFKCPFHGWQFGIDGKLKSIRDEETFRPEVIAHRPGLKEVACDTWNGIVFVSMNPKPEPLREFLGVVPEHLDRFKLDQFRVYADVEAWLDANWKLNMDAFVEFYHAYDVHPEINPSVDAYNTQYDLYPKGIGRMLIPFGFSPEKLPDRKTVNENLMGMLMCFGGNPEDYKHLSGDQYKAAIIDAKRKFGKRNGIDWWDQLTDDQMVDDWNYTIFPNVTLNVFADVCVIQRWRPHATDPTKGTYNAITINLPVPQDPAYRITDLADGKLGEPGWDGSSRPSRMYPVKLRDFGYVLEQDARLVTRVQKGVMSRAFEGYLLSEQEIRIRHYQAELDLYLTGKK